MQPKTNPTPYPFEPLKQYKAIGLTGTWINVGAPIVATDYDDAVTTAKAMFAVDGTPITAIYVWEVKP